ncbi:MAG: tetratricopeptide repeat protein, partial [Bacteroidota bacterium]
MFAEAFEEFSASRLWEFEEIEIDWKLEGMLQADLNEGLNNLLENNPLQAEASLNTVISKDSGVWQAYYYRAAARKQLKKFTSAQRDMQRSLKLHSDFYEGYVELAKILHLQNKYEESEKAIKRAIKLDPSKGTAYYLRGDINLSQNEVKSAINNYRDCLAADSLYHDARIKLALLDLLSKKDQSRALKHLNQVLVYDSLQKTALLFRSLLVADKDKKQSIRDLTNLIRVSPENLMAYYYRGVLSTELENYDQAFPDFQKVIKVTSASDNNFVGQQTWIDKKIDLQNAGAYTLTRVYGLPEGDGLKLKQAFCLIITEAFDKSIAIIDKIPDVENEPLALYLKAVAHEHKGDHNKALQLYHGALALDNEIADAHKKRAIYAQELKLWGESIKDLNEVLRLTPDAYIIHR